MIKIENTEIFGWEAAIRGMRNPMNSWEKSDSFRCKECYGGLCGRQDDCPVTEDNDFVIGYNDRELMLKLARAGSVHAKYRRMITVYVDITAPLYWWKEFDTYKIGTVANSCSTMHKIHAKEFTLEDFSCEHLFNDSDVDIACKQTLVDVIFSLNKARNKYLETKVKDYWWQMIQLLPTSYNQRRTIMLNYEVLTGIYRDRKNHKLDEWVEFCKWIEQLPLSEIITGRTMSEEDSNG